MLVVVEVVMVGAATDDDGDRLEEEVNKLLPLFVPIGYW